MKWYIFWHSKAYSDTVSKCISMTCRKYANTYI